MHEASVGRLQRIFSAGLLLSLALMAGRLAGFGRELVLASSLGLSAEADMAVLLLTLPDLLVNLLLSGGLAIALVPALQQAGPSQAARLFQQSSLWVAGLFSVLGVIVAFAPEIWLSALAPGVRVPSELAASGLLIALGASLPLSALAGISSAALQSHQRFFVAGCGTLIFNLSVISGLLLSPPGANQTLMVLCWAILLGTGLRWFSQLVVMPRSYFRSHDQEGGLSLSLLKTFGVGLMSASLLILAPVMVRSLASLLGPGQLAGFNFANKLIELPLGILITTLATIAYPRLCEMHSQGDPSGAKQVFSNALGRGLVLAVAVLGTGLCFGDAVVALLLQRGKIDANGAATIAQLLSIALFSVPLVSISSLATAALNARQQAALVLKLTLVALLALLALSAPGIYLGSGPMLMGGFVGFHAVYAGLTLWQLRAGPAGGAFGLEPKIPSALVFTALVCAAGALADHYLAATSPWERSALAVLTFGLSAAAGLRTFSNPNSSPRAAE